MANDSIKTNTGVLYICGSAIYYRSACSMVDKVVCNLCQMLLPIDETFSSRKAQHERWHSHTLKEKRNTIQGTVIWSIYNE